MTSFRMHAPTACIRGFPAYEFARNSTRYRAKEVALSRLDDIICEETDPWSKVRELWYCEEILDFEHREWCRLMLDTEWFG